MRQIIVHITDNFRTVFVARMIEWEHAVCLFLFGLVLCYNGELFYNNPSFAGLRRMLDAPGIWGAGAAAVGGARFCILVRNGTIRRSPHYRAICAFLSLGFWFNISVGLWMPGNFSTGLALYPTFACWEVVIFLLCVRYAKLEDAGFVRPHA